MTKSMRYLFYYTTLLNNDGNTYRNCGPFVWTLLDITKKKLGMARLLVISKFFLELLKLTTDFKYMFCVYW